MRDKHTLNHKQQKGAVLLLLMFAVIIGFATFFIVAYNNNKLEIQNDKETTKALGIAKQAVLNYVTANYHNIQTGDYGFLPCPDTSSGSGLADGLEHPGCFNPFTNAIGHLPWQTLGLSPLKDSTGSCLWYVATAIEKQDDPNNMTGGMISLYSDDRTTEISKPAEPFVAAIIAPKSALDYQNRTNANQNEICEQSFDATDYLDSTQLASGGLVNNAQVSPIPTSPDIFITAGKPSANTLPPYSAQNPQPFNDQIIYITWDELLAAIQKAGPATAPSPPLTEAELDESSAQITFTNDLANFDEKSGTGDYTSTPNGSNSTVRLHSSFFIDNICLWYNDTFELENKTLRTFFKLQLQEDTSNDSRQRCSGFTFTITPGPYTGCGTGGSGLGFHNMSPPNGSESFAVEYDITSVNFPFNRNDPAANHIAVVSEANNRHNSGNNEACPSDSCYFTGTNTPEERTWMEDGDEHSTRIEVHTGYTTSTCNEGDNGNGGNYARIKAWVDCPVGSCEGMGELDADYTDAGNSHLISQCIEYPSRMDGDPDNGGNGIRFGFTAAITSVLGCTSGTDITLSEFGLTIE